MVIVFEGCDAAGQGDAIKRLTEKLDSRFYVVYRNAPAEGEDKVRPYLYRFWRRLPGRGYIVIFDGSWYERVLADAWTANVRQANGTVPTASWTSSSAN